MLSRYPCIGSADLAICILSNQRVVHMGFPRARLRWYNPWTFEITYMALTSAWHSLVCSRDDSGHVKPTSSLDEVVEYVVLRSCYF